MWSDAGSHGEWAVGWAFCIVYSDRKAEEAGEGVVFVEEEEKGGKFGMRVQWRSARRSVFPRNQRAK